MSAGTIILTYRPRAGAARPHLFPMKTIARVRSGGSPGALLRDPTARAKRVGTRSPPMRRLGATGVGVVARRRRPRAVPRAPRAGPARLRAPRHAGCRAIETTRTLAASLGPPTAADGESSFDAALDTLVATQLLARERWGAEWMRRDRRGFEHAAERVAATARELARAASSMAAVRRDPRGGRRRATRSMALPVARPASSSSSPGSPSNGPQRARRAVDRSSVRPSSRRRGSRSRPAAPTRSPLALLAQGDAPALVVDTDVPLDQPFAAIARELAAEPPAHALCDGFEDEAWAAAAQVLDHLGRGERPVALVALDRVLVRRVRALLERAGVRIADETGWKMSTTRAGASVMSLLQAARPDRQRRRATSTGSSPCRRRRRPRRGSLAALEAICRRRRGRATRRGLAADALAGGRGASARRSDGHARRASRRRRGAAASTGSMPLHDGARRAGRARAPARRRRRPAGARRARHRPAARGRASRVARRRRRAADAGRVHALGRRRARARRPTARRSRGRMKTRMPLPADVVVTPLARAMLRPFAAVVMPGADHRWLGAMPVRRFAPAAQRRRRRFRCRRRRTGATPSCSPSRSCCACRAVTLSAAARRRRRSARGEPVRRAPRRAGRCARRGAPGDLRAWRDPRVERRLAPTPVRPTAPTVPADATAARACPRARSRLLRACPYRFFAERVLRLRALDELDDEVEKRDYGTWLHDVLHALPSRRGEPAPASPPTTARLRAIGDGVPRVAWPRRRRLPALQRLLRGAGAALRRVAARTRAAGRALVARRERAARGAGGAGGVELHGRIDRIDIVDGGGRLELIDYKTGSASKLKKQCAIRFEDTQLAFYAALVGARSAAAAAACYLADRRDHGA